MGTRARGQIVEDSPIKQELIDLQHRVRITIDLLDFWGTLTRQDVADMLGWNLNTVHNRFNGRATVSLMDVAAWASVYKLEAQQIVAGMDEQQVIKHLQKHRMFNPEPHHLKRKRDTDRSPTTWYWSTGIAA